ncbi:MAG TPA: DUF429 domain-containing protein [Dongiaceae bacterium]|nr:DUF429 domain-containing protein [Dongiaceae bacterium]
MTVRTFRLSRRRYVYGVDFSAAKKAGEMMWIAGGLSESGGLRIDGCMAVGVLPGSGLGYDRCFATLVDIITLKQEGIFGVDFPFSLPKELIEAERWEDFVCDFPQRFASAEAFRESCRAAAGGKELKRATDRRTRTPFSAYNIRLFRQTYYGIGRVLRPLLLERRAAVLPFERAAPDLALVIETCPASTLKAEGLYLSYKGKDPERTANRLRILGALTTRYLARPVPAAAKRAVRENAGGDALDSIIAAIAAYRALRDPAALARTSDPVEALEGRVYV